MIILATLLFLLCEFKGVDYLNQGYLGIFIFSVIISVKLWKKYHPVVSILYLYTSLLALVYIIVPLFFYKGNPSLETTVILGLQTLTFYTFLYNIVLVVPFLFMKKEHENEFVVGIALLALVDAYILFIKILLGKLPYWLMNNPAIDVSFISCVIPFLITWALGNFSWTKKNVLKVIGLVGVPVFACIASKTSSGVLGVGVGIASFFWSRNGLKKVYLYIATGFAAIVAGVGYLMQKGQLFEGSGRYLVWQHSIEFWNSQVYNLNAPYIPHSIGAGLGSFFMYGPTLQMEESIKNGWNSLDIFFWLHNDWLQVLFETGYIGVLLTIIMFAMAVYKSRHIPTVFASLLTYGAISFIQMPLRHAIFAFFGLFLIAQAFSASKESAA